jgi:hypothetical protein
MNLKDQLKEKFNLDNSDFDSHESDLYVRNKKGICDFLTKEKIYFSLFISNIPPCISWIDIPFYS